MQKPILILVSVAAVVAVASGLFLVMQPQGLACPEPSLRLVFKYGVDGKNVLDTYRGIYTKDMVVDPPKTVRMCLLEEDLERIYEKMVEIGFFDSYPGRLYERVEREVVGECTPYSTFYFRVQCGDSVKELRWSDRFDYSGNEGAEDLMELIRLIIEIIEATPEYKKLPEPRAGYA